MIPAEGIRLEEWERRFVTQALERTAWNVTRAAKLLLTRDTLRYRIEKYCLSAPSKADVAADGM